MHDGARLVDMVAGAVSSRAERGAPAWDVIIGDRFIAAVVAPAPQTVLTALAEAASDPDPTVEALVGAMPVGRVDPIGSFALVWWPAGDWSQVTAVVRGDAVVDLDSPGGSRRFDARGIRPWHLAEFEDVVALRLTAADAVLERIGSAADRVPHARASVRASAVEWSADATRAGGPGGAERAAPEVATDHAPAGDTILVRRREADTMLAPPRAVRDADTILTQRAPRRARTTPTVPTPPETPTAPEAIPVPEGPRFRVGDGPIRSLTVPVLIGRRPMPPRIAGIAGPAPELLSVDSPGSVVSGTHLELRLEGTRLVATDLRSTNGTTVRTAAGNRRMRAGESVVVAPGSRLDLGDDTIIEILPAPGTSLE